LLIFWLSVFFLADLENIDARENKMKKEIGKYAQGLRDNIEKNKRKNKQLMSEKAKQIDKSKITLEFGSYHLLLLF
jgi:hypothetical protein